MNSKSEGSSAYDGVVSNLRHKLETMAQMTLDTNNFETFDRMLRSMLYQNDAVVIEKQRAIMEKEDELKRLLEKADKSKQDTIGNAWFDTTNESVKIIRQIKEMLDWLNLEFEIMQKAIEKFEARVKEVNAIQNEKFVLEARIKLKELDDIQKTRELAHQLDMRRLELQEKSANQPQPKPIAPPPYKPATQPDNQEEDKANDDSYDDDEEDDSEPQPNNSVPKASPRIDDVITVEKTNGNTKVKYKRLSRAEQLAEPKPRQYQELKEFVHRKMLAGISKNRLRKSYKIPQAKMKNILDDLIHEGRLMRVKVPNKIPPLDNKWVAVEKGGNNNVSGPEDRKMQEPQVSAAQAEIQGHDTPLQA